MKRTKLNRVVSVLMVLLLCLSLPACAEKKAEAPAIDSLLLTASNTDPEEVAELLADRIEENRPTTDEDGNAAGYILYLKDQQWMGRPLTTTVTWISQAMSGAGIVGEGRFSKTDDTLNYLQDGYDALKAQCGEPFVTKFRNTDTSDFWVDAGYTGDNGRELVEKFWNDDELIALDMQFYYPGDKSTETHGHYILYRLSKSEILEDPIGVSVTLNPSR